MDAKHRRVSPRGVGGCLRAFHFAESGTNARRAAPLTPRVSPGAESLCAGLGSDNLRWGWPPIPMRGISLGSHGPNSHKLASAFLRRARQQSEKADTMDFLKPRLHRMKGRRRIYEGKAKVLYEGP